jgi:hypothetical protein
MEETPWDKYGNSKNPKCANCMAHCGFEASAVEDAMKHPLKAAWVSLVGPRTSGPMADEPTPEYETQPSKKARRTISIEAVD